MKFEEFDTGKMYKTRDGQRAKIWMSDNGGGLMYGAISRDGSLWNIHSWNSEGVSTDGNAFLKNDLVGEWRDPIKYFVELWGNEWKLCLTALGLNSQLLGSGHLTAVNKTETCPIKYRITVEEIA